MRPFYFRITFWDADTYGRSWRPQASKCKEFITITIQIEQSGHIQTDMKFLMFPPPLPELFPKILKIYVHSFNLLSN